MSDGAVQSCGFLLELSPDWLIQRASENSHGFLGQYHQRLIGEPLADFTLAQALHDLRNALASQRSSSGISRVYNVRLIDDPRYFDIAFQLRESSIILEGLPSAGERHGAFMGSVSRLIDGLRIDDRQKMMDAAARRMRARTGFDQIRLVAGQDRVENSRGLAAIHSITGELPAILADVTQQPVALFPRKDAVPIHGAMLQAPTAVQAEELQEAGFASGLRVSFSANHGESGFFECYSKVARGPSFELHAAAELFAQIFGMLLPA